MKLPEGIRKEIEGIGHASTRLCLMEGESEGESIKQLHKADM
jgi:hypothetical protein